MSLFSHGVTVLLSSVVVSFLSGQVPLFSLVELSREYLPPMLKECQAQSKLNEHMDK